MRPIWRFPSKNPTDEIGRLSLATTERRWRAARHWPCIRQDPGDGRPTSDLEPDAVNLVFGIGLVLPVSPMFFASWKSDATIRMNSDPGLSGFASLGTGRPRCPSRDRTGWHRLERRGAGPEEEPQRERVDAGFLVSDLRDNRRSPRGDHAIEQPHRGWPDVVHPRAQRVGAGEGTPGEEVASGIHRDVVATWGRNTPPETPSEKRKSGMSPLTLTGMPA